MAELKVKAWEKKTPVREYVVLERLTVDPTEESKDWRVLGTETATTDRQAISNTLKRLELGGLGGTYVAVPARSWRPVTRRVEKAEQVRWEE